MRRVYEDEYFLIEVDDICTRIEMTRSALPFASISAILSMSGRIASAFEAEGAGKVSLLVDSTLAPKAKGGSYKKAFERFADFLISRFERVAVVVSSREAALAEIREASGRRRVDFFTNREAARRALSTPRSA